MIDQSILKNFEDHGFNVDYYQTNGDLIAKINELIPEGSQVMTMSSVTLDDLGVSKHINESGEYDAIKPKLYSGDPNAAASASMPQIAIGSVQAATESGELIVASATGSQIPAYVYGAKQVIFVVSTRKIVADIPAALQRIYEQVLPLEDKRAMQAYGKGSSVNKLLILNKEPIAGRTHILFIDQPLGY